MSAFEETPAAGRVDGWVWPAGLRPPERLEETLAAGLLVRHPSPDADPSRALAASLRAARPGLSSIPVAELADIVGRAGEAMVGGLDGDAVHDVAANAGLSAAMAAEVVHGMAASWNVRALRRLVTAEFPDPRVLDGFVAGRGRAISAAGPGLTLHLGAGTVPGVTVTSMMRALLVKSAVLAKPGAGDVSLTVRFARELARIDPRVGAAVAVQYWPGGDAAWDRWERDVFRTADQIVIHGSDAAIESVRARAPASTRLVEHPHRAGVAVVKPRGAPEAAAEVARAATLFDQRGCVSTQLVFLLDDGSGVRGWCAALAGELAALEEALPPGRHGPADLSAMHQFRGRLRMMGAASAGAGPNAVHLWHGESSRWTVVLAPADAFEPALCPAVWVVAAPDVHACLRALAPLAPVLQTVGLAGFGADRANIARELSGLGATRMVPLSQVPYPAADWLHDGKRPLGELVRWSELR